MAAFEVIALDTATPQLRAPGASDTYTHPRQSLFLAGTAAAPGIAGNSDDNTGMLWPAADTVAWATGGTERMRLDASGNLGLGVTPSAWGSGAKVLQFANTGAIGSEINGYLTSTVNAVETSSGNWTYISSGLGAARQRINYGSYEWYTAPSGTAGNAISFTQAMTLDASGNLLVGTTDTTAVRFKVQAGSEPIMFLSGFSGAGTLGVIGANPLAIYTNGNERARITSTGNVVAGGSVALATTATDGFLYVPTCAGTPTGTPTAITGMAPIVVDTTNNKLYFYSNAVWRDAGP